MKLAGKSNDELVQMIRVIESDPANQLPKGGLYLFTPDARKKLDAIARAITNNLIDARAAAGNPVKADGYSGRQSNKRR